MNGETLVLNKYWNSVNTCCVKKAIKMTYSNRARIVDPYPWNINSGRYQYSSYDLMGWAERGVLPNYPIINLHGFKIQTPEIIVLNHFSKPPAQIVKYCRRNLWIRDNFSCQYCGKHPPKDEITVDHILPRSRGGLSSFENTVLACVDCNKKKEDRTPEEANMRLRCFKKNNFGIYEQHFYDRPTKPYWDPIFVVKKMTYKESWKKFVKRLCDDAYWEIQLEP